MAVQEAAINLIVSVVLVFKFGLIGVALGTAASCLVRTIRYYMFFNKNVLFLSVKKILKRITIAVISAVACAIVFELFNFKSETYLAWFIHGAIYFVTATVIAGGINSLAFKDDCMLLLRKLKICK